MAKISFLIVLSITIGCATIQGNKELTFNDCVYQCMVISRENDIDNITASNKANMYLIYLCGVACREKATTEEWKNFCEGFEIKQDIEEFI